VKEVRKTRKRENRTKSPASIAKRPSCMRVTRPGTGKGGTKDGGKKKNRKVKKGVNRERWRKKRREDCKKKKKDKNPGVPKHLRKIKIEEGSVGKKRRRRLAYFLWVVRNAKNG